MTTSKSFPEDLLKTLAQFNQTHLLQWWKSLNEQQQDELTTQIQSINFAQIQQLFSQAHSSKAEETPAQKAERATCPANVVRLQDRLKSKTETTQAILAGKKLLAEGKVGAILVAGGQGSRLGFHRPKGMYPVGPAKQTSLFQILMKQLIARSLIAGKPICYFIMTSDATHDETVAYFKENKDFGLQEDQLYFFKQGTMPAVDAQSSKILLEDKHRIAVSPDGHGGTLKALKNSGLFEVMQKKGIEYLYYHQVDNPTAIVCDPEFLGYHLQSQAEVSVKVVSKRTPDEKMGIVCDVDDQTQIIEYSDLPVHISEKVDPSGNLLHWAGSTAIHVFNRSFLEQIANDDELLPFHQANKKVPFIGSTGTQISPTEPNAIKFERFIFDVMPVAKKVLVYEIDRQREFNPLKNADGADSPETVDLALQTIYSNWVCSSEIKIKSVTEVDISLLIALDEIELKTIISQEMNLNGSINLTE